jgi:DNA-binding HxlR family transcriptional regulator
MRKMPRRQYSQECPVACALDRIGERWSLLVVRELSLGPLRFSDLARAVGGAPTDVLSRRLRDLEGDGVVVRRELAPPASAVVYELTELGRGLERPMLDLGRWGMNLQALSDVAGIRPSSLPNGMRMILQAPADVAMTVQMRSEGHASWLRIADGWIGAGRGEVEAADLTLTGPPLQVIAAVVVGAGAGEGAVVEGSPEALEALRAMVAIPAHLREEARTMLGAAVA